MSKPVPLLSLWLRFLSSGGAATLVHWMTMWGLIQLGCGATWATAVGATVGAVVNYFLQYHLTFACKTAHSVVIPDYIKAVLAGWLSNLLLFYLLFHFIVQQAAWAQLFTTAGVMLINFSLYNKMVFHDRE